MQVVLKKRTQVWKMPKPSANARLARSWKKWQMLSALKTSTLPWSTTRRTSKLSICLRRCDADALRKRLSEWFSSFHGPIGFEMRDLNITAGNDVAFCHSLNGISATTTAGAKIDMWWRATNCFRKADGHWLVTHGQGRYWLVRTVSGQIRKQLDTVVRPKSKLSKPIKKLKAVWVEPSFAAEIEYRDITSDGLLRQSSFKGLKRS